MSYAFARKIKLGRGTDGVGGGGGPVVLLGDSLSVGTGPFLKTLLPELTTFAKVGAPISWMIGQTNAINALSPRLVLVMGGTNDIMHGLSPVEIANRMTNLVKAIDSTVVVGQIPTMIGREDTVDRYNDLLASRFNAAPVGDVITPGELIASDGVHPGPSGYRKMAEAWTSSTGSKSRLLPALGVVVVGIVSYFVYDRFIA